MKKYLSFLLCLSVLLTLCACGGNQEPAGPSVSVRVEGISENLAYDTSVPLTEDASALALVCALLDKLDIPYDTDAGYLTAVGHDKAGAFDGWDGFVFYLNGEESLTAPGVIRPKDGDVLLFCYADLSGEPPTLMPKIEAQRGSDGLVTLTVLGGKLTFQGDTPLMEYAPVVEAEVTVNEVLYYTDENGQLVLDRDISQKSRVSMQVEHYTEDGRPLLIRLEPGFELDLPK